MTFDLPEPPSLNRMWRRVGNRTVLSAEGRAYKERVGVLARLQGAKVIKGPVAVELTWRRGRRAGDLDNRWKVIGDSLNGIAYEDDAKIVELHLYRVDDKANPGATVTVRAA